MKRIEKSRSKSYEDFESAKLKSFKRKLISLNQTIETKETSLAEPWR